MGVFYGTANELSANYKKIDEDYPVIVGQEFWQRLTGDENFYSDLINTIAESAIDEDCSSLLNDTIKKLAEEIKNDPTLM